MAPFFIVEADVWSSEIEVRFFKSFILILTAVFVADIVFYVRYGYTHPYLAVFIALFMLILLTTSSSRRRKADAKKETDS